MTLLPAVQGWDLTDVSARHDLMKTKTGRKSIGRCPLLAWLSRFMVAVGGLSPLGCKSMTVVAALLCSMRRK